MAVLNIVLYPDEPLKDVATPISKVGPSLVKLAEDMLETMHTYDGVGLAGPQVGVSKRIIVVHEPEETPLCLLNPVIVESDGRAVDIEGCLSLPEISAPVKRATHIRVQAMDLSGQPVDFEANDFLARIVQHECDHLDGIVFPDRCDILTRQATMREWEEVRERLLAAPLEG